MGKSAIGVHRGGAIVDREEKGRARGKRERGKKKRERKKKVLGYLATHKWLAW